MRFIFEISEQRSDMNVLTPKLAMPCEQFKTLDCISVKDGEYQVNRFLGVDLQLPKPGEPMDRLNFQLPYENDTLPSDKKPVYKFTITQSRQYTYFYTQYLDFNRRLKSVTREVFATPEIYDLYSLIERTDDDWVYFNRSEFIPMNAFIRRTNGSTIYCISANVLSWK